MRKIAMAAAAIMTMVGVTHAIAVGWTPKGTSTKNFLANGSSYSLSLSQISQTSDGETRGAVTSAGLPSVTSDKYTVAKARKIREDSRQRQAAKGENVSPGPWEKRSLPTVRRPCPLTFSIDMFSTRQVPNVLVIICAESRALAPRTT